MRGYREGIGARVLVLAGVALAVLILSGMAWCGDDPLAIRRPKAVYREALTGKKMERELSSWYHGVYRSQLPGDVQARYTDAAWAEEQGNYLRESAAAGVAGPFMPWSLTNLGMETVTRLHRETGMLFPAHLHSSWHANRAKASERAVFFLENTVAPWDSAYRAAKLEFMENWLGQHGAAPWLGMINGRDEPLNLAASVRDPRAADRVNEALKREYGVTLALSHGDTTTTWADWPTDPNIAGKPAHEVALLRVALWRWLNGQIADAALEEEKLVRRLAPGKTYFAYNRNAINIRDVIDKPVRHSMDFLDQSRIFEYTDGFAADPYPTATLARDGRARALYHVGFASKLVTDLGAGKPSKLILQAFDFEGHRPVAANLREWASQAAKTGATHLEWYTQGNTRFAWPDLHAETLRLSRLWKDLPAPAIPERTEVAVIFSDDSRAARNDAALHQYYTLHTLLGERLGAWFAFTGENHVRRGFQSLDSASLIIAPELSWTSREFIIHLSSRVKAGATLVILDPDALTWDVETGSLAPERLNLLGASSGAERGASLLRVTETGRKRFGDLPALPLMPGPEGVRARTLSALPGAEMLFTFEDGSPAVYARPHGKGEVIVFAARPFGNSELALAPAGWDRFFAALLDAHGARRNLPVWRFEFPKTGGEVKVFAPTTETK